MIQPAVKAIEALIQDGQSDWAVEGFQLFQSMLDCQQTIITSNMVPSLVEWAALIFRQVDAEGTVRCAAGNFLSGIVTSKSKTIKKAKLTKTLIELCFPILIEDSEEDDEDDEEESPRNMALQLLGKVSDFYIPLCTLGENWS